MVKCLNVQLWNDTNGITIWKYVMGKVMRIPHTSFLEIEVYKQTWMLLHIGQNVTNNYLVPTVSHKSKNNFYDSCSLWYHYEWLVTVILSYYYHQLSNTVMVIHISLCQTTYLIKASQWKSFFHLHHLMKDCRQSILQIWNQWKQTKMCF